MKQKTTDIMRNLINFLNYHTKLYNEGKSKISDKDWDDKYFELKELENKTNLIFPDSPTQVINYEIVSNLNKVNHNHKMLSLDKTKDWGSFLNYFSSIDTSKDVVGMLKLDGLTCSLRYINGELVSAETRGNGEIGENILHNARVISSIPKIISYKEELIIDGEIICTLDDFKIFSNEYKNPRNFAAGSIRLLDSKECAKRKLTFVAWNIVKGFDDNNSFMYKLQEIEKLGFIITPWTSSFDWDAKEYLENKATKYGYPIDGLVGRFDDIAFGNKLGSTGHHSRAAYAFKFYDETYETILINIDYDISRMGEMVPVAIFEPIDDGDSIITRATLHNLSVMEELSKGSQQIGDTLTIFKANSIIPQVETWTHKEIPNQNNIITIPEKCPCCGRKTVINISDSGVKTLFCGNPSCERKLVNRINHFCGKTALDIKGLSTATIEKLINWGWVNEISDIYLLENYKKEWYNKSGFGKKSVDKILDSISKSREEVSFDRFLVAIGIPLIGVEQAKEINKKFSNYEDFIDAVELNYNWMELPNFGEQKYLSIQNFDYTEAKKIKNYLSFKKNSDIIYIQNKLKDLIFVITGSLEEYKNRNELKKIIEDNGGKVTGSISNKTNYLINNDIHSNSEKNVKAKKLNIPIISEKYFIENFL